MRETPQIFPTLRGLWWFYITCGAVPTARDLAEDLYRLAQRTATPLSRLEAHATLGNTLVTGQMLTGPLCMMLLAEATGHTGQIAAGLHWLAEARTALEAIGRGDMLTEAYRLQGELLLRQAAPDAIQAEVCFQQALAIARRQQAKSWELRSALSLSRLWQQQGKWAEACELLAPIYGWFTEGLDTADLRDARALLENLAWEPLEAPREPLLPSYACNGAHTYPA